MSADVEMKYEKLVELYEVLDSTTKRLEKTSLIADFLSMVGEEESKYSFNYHFIYIR